MKSPTRQDYMNGDVTHEQYYNAIVETAGIEIPPNVSFISRCADALAKGDEHLNSIPLREWDERAANQPGLARALRAHGDTPTLAGFVCVVKQAAKIAVKARG